MAAANEGAAQGKGKSIGGESVRDAGGVVDGRGLDLPFNKSRMQSWKMKIIYVFIYICINYIYYINIYIYIYSANGTANGQPLNFWSLLIFDRKHKPFNFYFMVVWLSKYT